MFVFEPLDQKLAVNKYLLFNLEKVLFLFQLFILNFHFEIHYLLQQKLNLIWLVHFVKTVYFLVVFKHLVRRELKCLIKLWLQISALFNWIVIAWWIVVIVDAFLVLINDPVVNYIISILFIINFSTLRPRAFPLFVHLRIKFKD